MMKETETSIRAYRCAENLLTSHECRVFLSRQRRDRRLEDFRRRLWTLLVGLAMVSSACARLIAWPAIEPDQEFVRRHISAMERKPFDGVVLAARIPGLEGLTREFAWSAVTRRYTAAEFQPVVSTLRGIPFRRFLHNFLRINVNPMDHPFDMFDDDRWGILTGNFTIVAAAAQAARFRGLMVDPEAYATVNPETQRPRFNVFDFRLRRTPQGLSAYRRQAFARGEVVGRAVTAAYPGITLLLAFGPGATCLHRAPEEEQVYGLLAAFVDGLLAGTGGRATVVEGSEFAYPYRSCDRFQETYATLRGACRQRSLDPAKYDRWLEIGFGLWLDFGSVDTCQDPAVAGRPCRWFDPSLYPPDRQYLIDPDRFTQAVASALAVSEGYVWIYTNEPKWWTEENPLGENLPEPYVAALVEGRKATALACPRPRQSPLGHIIPRSDR
ncbi:MAG TPA: hypothetical protein VGC81_00245 [Candidatus Methylomirabilis sp.]